ncbi:2-oxoacid:ferredoxin oxidoreductase subunit beta [Candidatus Parcubacteria bacterium]|nr:2-oxoacid:ferredoxin oxidoreductase subunit beta [Candidatus Parcubacteria bacterium]
MKNLLTGAKITWCPGCSNFIILEAIKHAILELEKRGIKREKIVICGGIGCHAKILDYLNLNSFYGLHGRSICSAQGIKLANPELKVLVFVGDGDIYNEGICHLIHAAKRNSDIKVFVHDNRNFALTVSQFTATSPKGFKGSSTPKGSQEEPINPMELMLVSGATFVARGFVGNFENLKNIFLEAILHQGFSFVEILQPCITFFDTTKIYQERVYELKDHNFSSFKEAIEKAREWDYKDGQKIPIGIFYKIQKPTFETQIF